MPLTGKSMTRYHSQPTSMYGCFRLQTTAAAVIAASNVTARPARSKPRSRFPAADTTPPGQPDRPFGRGYETYDTKAWPIRS